MNKNECRTILLFVNSLILVLFLLVFGCDNNKEHKNIIPRIADSIHLKYAHGFNVVRFADGFILEVKKPWQGSRQTNYHYILYRNQKPEIQLSNSVFIKIPATRVICMSTTHIAFIESLGKVETIKAVSGLQYVINPTLKSYEKQGLISDVGYDQNLNFELILSLKPDVVFVYGIGSESSGMISRLNNLGITTVFIGEYLEAHPLAKTEWIKFVSSFYDKMPLADSLFNAISHKYSQLLLLTRNIENKPLIMAGLPYKDSWYISGGKTYLAKLIEDAGGNYVFKNIDQDVIPMSLEKVYENACNADIWINAGESGSLSGLLSSDTRLGHFKPFRNKQVFCNTALSNNLGGNDYWESGIMNPHLILQDLITIIHPELVINSKMVYYIKLE